MFSILIYIMLPFIYLFHAIEEIAKRRRWARLSVDRIGGMNPNMRPMLVHLRDMSNRSFCIIVVEELSLISLAAICAIYGTFSVSLFALTWGICIHFVLHTIRALAIKGYIPGLITSVILLPYAGIAVADMLQQFSWHQNLLYAVSGITIVILNKIVMHTILNK